MGFALDDEDEVYFAPMYYDEGDLEDEGNQVLVGDSNYNYFFGRIDFDEENDEIVYRSWAYDTDYDVEHDIYEYDEWSHDIPSGEDSFYYGYQSVEIDDEDWPVGFLQVGIEGNDVIPEDDETWRVHLGHFGYYNGSDWKYKSAKSMIGERAYIAWASGIYWVGGDNYTNCDKLFF